MKKKSDKIILVIIVMLLMMVVSWFVPGGTFSSGTYVESGMTRAGIYELFYLIYYTLTNQSIAIDMVYILTIGGCYGVLSQTKSYAKLVDKTAKLIKGKEAIAMLVITFLMGAYISIANQLLLMFCVVPFIVTVFLRNGCKKLTAISAAFGGMFIGTIGLTYGTFGMNEINSMLATLPNPVDKLILLRVVIFFAAYILFNLFAILYMNKYERSANGSKFDLLCPIEVDESKVAKRKKTKVWPTATIIVISLIVVMLAYINWMGSFDVIFFRELHARFENALVIGDIPLLSTLLGGMIEAFGEYSELAFACFVFITMSLILALVNKTSIDNYIKNFGAGVKKVSKVAFIYGFTHVIVILLSQYTWPITFINALFGDGTFSIFSLLIIAIIGFTLCVDFESFGSAYGAYIIMTYMEDLASATLIWHLGAAIAAVFVPTSFLVLVALTYADVPYVKWLKYIWKFVASFMIIVFVILAVAILM